MGWLDLPTEIWLHIFSFIPQCFANQVESANSEELCLDREEICLVCRQFNSIMLNIEKCHCADCFWRGIHALQDRMFAD